MLGFEACGRGARRLGHEHRSARDEHGKPIAQPVAQPMLVIEYGGGERAARAKQPLPFILTLELFDVLGRGLIRLFGLGRPLLIFEVVFVIARVFVREYAPDGRGVDRDLPCGLLAVERFGVLVELVQHIAAQANLGKVELLVGQHGRGTA